jgi:Holliday junction resolvase RusA-like endonuclease
MAAAPQGSKRHVGKGVMIESCANVKPWRLLVAQAAMARCAPSCGRWADWQWAVWSALHRSPGLTAAELLKEVGPRRHRITQADVSSFLPVLRDCMARQETQVLRGPVRMSVIFRFKRPANHYRRDGTLKPLNASLSSATSREAPQFHCVKPDLDKVERSTKDALSRLAYEDDARIVAANGNKRWCVGDERPGALITVIPLGGG